MVLIKISNFIPYSLFIFLFFCFAYSQEVERKVNLEYDEENLSLKIQKTPYRIFYTSFNEINIFLPFYEIYDSKIAYKFYEVNTFSYANYYSVIKVRSAYPLPYSYIKVSEDGDDLIFLFPLSYKLSGSVHFYDNDRNYLCKVDWFFLVDKFLNSTKGIFSYRLNIEDPEVFNIDFHSKSRREDLSYYGDGFWIAINGTYFARKEVYYTTVAGVILKDKVLSYPVDYRPSRGYFSVLKDKNQNSSILVFDRLPVGRNFEKFLEKVREFYDVEFLLQAGPLIYKDNLFVMDPDSEGFGKGGNNIVDPAPRTFVLSDGKSLYFEVLYGYNLKRNEGLSLYELSRYIEDIAYELKLNNLNALNLDGGSSSCIYVNGRKLVPFHLKNVSYNSQNYVIFYYPKKEVYYVSDKIYYFFPGVFDVYSQTIYNPVFGSSFVTFFDGIDKYDKLLNNDNLDYLISGNLVFFQANDFDEAIKKLPFSKEISKVFRYYNCYVIEWRE